MIRINWVTNVVVHSISIDPNRKACLYRYFVRNAVAGLCLNLFQFVLSLISPVNILRLEPVPSFAFQILVGCTRDLWVFVPAPVTPLRNVMTSNTYEPSNASLNCTDNKHGVGRVRFERKIAIL